MNKLYSLSILLCVSLFFASCKKDNGNNSNPTGGTSGTPAYVAASQPGHISLSATSLVVRRSGTGTITASLYNSDGTLVTPPPSFQFTASDATIASVDNSGNITPLATGLTAVTVTDGSHGFAYASVQVVDDTTTISTGTGYRYAAGNISFTPGIVTLATGATANFNYQLTDAAGASVSGSAIFAIAPTTGISISGNTISATTAGVYTVTATTSSGGALAGSLTVIVTAPGSGTATCTGTDADWEVLSVKIMNCPWFSKVGLTADPLRVEVSRRRKCAPYDVHVIQRSPDAVTLGLAGVVNLTSDGKLHSVKPGVSTVTATVGGVSSLVGGSMVMDHVEGNYVYSGKIDNISANIGLSIFWPPLILYADVTPERQTLAYSEFNFATFTGCGTSGNDAYEVFGLSTAQADPDCNYNISSGGVYFHGTDCLWSLRGILGYFLLQIRKTNANPPDIYGVGMQGYMKGSNGSYAIVDQNGVQLGTLAPGTVPNCQATCQYATFLTNGSSRTWTSNPFVDGGSGQTITLSAIFKADGTGNYISTGPNAFNTNTTWQFCTDGQGDGIGATCTQYVYLLNSNVFTIDMTAGTISIIGNQTIVLH